MDIKVDASKCGKNNRICDNCENEKICTLLSVKYYIPFIVKNR